MGHAFIAARCGLAFFKSRIRNECRRNSKYIRRLIVADATLKAAKTKEEKINLLDTKLQNALAMFMNIHSRFIFENRFYEARQEGLVSEDKITEMMVEAQKERLLRACSQLYHPYFWAAKLHFFIDDVPFYNFHTPLATCLV